MPPDFLRLAAFAIIAPRGSSAVVADGFDRAAFHGFLAELFLVGAAWLLVDVGVTAVVVAAKIAGGGFAAKIAVDALIIDVIFAGNIFGIAVCDVSHSFLRSNKHYTARRQAQCFFCCF